MSELNKIIGKRIKDRRKELKLTQKELGERVGAAEITIRQYESGRYSPKIDMRVKLSEALECDYTDLFLPPIEVSVTGGEELSFGELVRAEREKAGLSQSELADMSGVALSVIEGCESGESDPGYEDSKRLCAALNIGFLPGIDEQLAESLPANIRAARESTLCSLDRLSQLTGLPLTTIQDFEEGRKQPSTDALDRIARALGISANQLYDLNSPPAPSGLDNEIRSIRNGGSIRYDVEISRKAAAVVAFEDLNEDGQMCAVDLLKLVSKVPEYKRPKD